MIDDEAIVEVDPGGSMVHMSYLNAAVTLLSYVSVSSVVTRRRAGEGRREPMSVALMEIPLSIRRVLVLEDNFIIAMEAEDILRSLGVEHVEIATNVTQATGLIDSQPFDFALLDVNLGSETSFDFAGILMKRGMAFGFVSGYGENSIFPAALREIPRISKPFNETSMAGLLASATST